MGFSDLNLQRTVKTQPKPETKIKSAHLIKPLVSTQKLIVKQKFERRQLSRDVNQNESNIKEVNTSDSSSRSASTNSAPSVNSLIIKAPKPPYPWLARKAGFEGNVIIAVKLAQSGKVSKARVVKSSSRDDCDQSALKTILNEWQFVELSKSGLSENEEIKLQIVYKLD
jgi:protein TonB